MLPNKNFGNIIEQLFLVLFGGAFLGSLVFGGLTWIIQQFQTIDIDKAKENNAIAPADTVFEL